MPDSAKDEEKILPVILDKHVEILPPDLKSLREEITVSPQLSMEERALSTEQKSLRITPEFKMKDTAEFKVIIEDFGKKRFLVVILPRYNLIRTNATVSIHRFIHVLLKHCKTLMKVGIIQIISD